MAKIQLVIEIEEETYQNVLHQVDDIDSISVDALELEDAVYNSTPLPKGHGRIIDESKITSIYYHEGTAKQGAIALKWGVIDGTDAPTIIEADGGGKE